MDNYFIPVKTIFDDKFVNVLSIDSGLEFFADDIFSLVGCQSTGNPRTGVISETDISNCLGINLHYDLPENLRRIRTVLIDGLLCKKQTLCWLALKHVFRQFKYDKQKEFVHWIRKSLSPALALEKFDNSNVKMLDGINLLSWFFIDSDKCIDSLVSIYQSNLFNFFGALPSIIPTADNFNSCCREGSQNEADNSLLPCLSAYDIYLKLLKKELTIPDYQILHTSDLAARLLRQRYLESASIVLGVNNVEYFNLYDTFVCSRQDLLLAQELDIAIIFALKKRTIPYFMLQVIEGGFFLQSLLACTLAGIIEKSLSLSIKQVYTHWLNNLLVNIRF